MRLSKKILGLSITGLFLCGIVFGYQHFFNDNLEHSKFYQGNGSVQITNIHISSKYPGRIQDIYVKEGDFVAKGDLIAVMQVDDLKAQLLEAKALYAQAVNGVESAKVQLSARKSEKNAAEAVVRQQKGELQAAQARLERVQKLVRRGAVSKQDLDDQTAFTNSLESAVASAEAQVLTTQAAIDIAKTQITSSESQVKAVEASIVRIEAEIKDANLVAPVDGRIQYRVASVGEVVPAGGIVLSMVDLSDIYMTFFIPERLHTLISVGDEVRVILDGMPDRVIAAKLYFISPSAQFTPKYVETKNEREKMMFRVKARFNADFVREFKETLKVGVRGVAWMNLDGEGSWPAQLMFEEASF